MATFDKKPKKPVKIIITPKKGGGRIGPSFLPKNNPIWMNVISVILIFIAIAGLYSAISENAS
ncbi:hypothetical protein IT397_01505, partial [Candidatus Nomurabacteria bacterium]|nr:hypothetical protein [Candidatus Nomurabacteria bacterium]